MKTSKLPKKLERGQYIISKTGIVAKVMISLRREYRVFNKQNSKVGFKMRGNARQARARLQDEYGINYYNKKSRKGWKIQSRTLYRLQYLPNEYHPKQSMKSHTQFTRADLIKSGCRLIVVEEKTPKRKIKVKSKKRKIKVKSKKRKIKVKKRGSK